MAPERLPAAWVRSLETSPELFVNRQQQMDDALFKLQDVLDQSDRPNAKKLIMGQGGVGKSIFCRALLAKFAAANPQRVVPLEVNGRSTTHPRFLKQFADELVDALEPLSQHNTDAARWRDELALLAYNQQITRAQIDTKQRKYGASSSLGASLFDLLGAKLRSSWEEVRSAGRTESATQFVTPELMEDAIARTLAFMQDHDLVVSVLYDDFDQAHEADIKGAVHRLLALGPCIALVHMRSEVADADLLRELPPMVALEGLTPDALEAMLRRRADLARKEIQTLLKLHGIWSAFRRLAGVTTNPLAFLKWVEGLLDAQRAPLPEDWTHQPALLRLLRKVTLTGVEDELACRLVAIIDRCAVAGHAPTQAELEAGHLQTDTAPAKGLARWEFENLVRLGYLIPLDRDQAQRGYRVQPELMLLSAAAQAKLREAPD